MRLKYASSLVLAWALCASIAVHALVLLLPAFSLPRSLTVHDNAVTFITARLEPPAPEATKPETAAKVEAAPEVLKNTLTPPAAKPKPPPRAAPQLRERPAREPAERLAGEQLNETLGRLSGTLLYPPEALRRGLEGEVVLMLELDAQGRIVAASVASGSGHALLDEAALRAARQLGALGPSVAGKAILLPVRFRIL